MNAPHGRTALAIRRMLPERFKVLLRIGRLLLRPVPPAAPDVPQALLEECRVLTSRYEMLDRLPRGGRVAEIGTFEGRFAAEILARCRPDELHIVDVTMSLLDPAVRANPVVTLHEDLSAPALGRFADASFDWIYIDADHGYDAVRSDIAAAAPKVKPGGLLLFNDFGRIVRPGFGVFGVHQAVCEFAVERGWPFVFLCLHGEALYDVALRRPVD